MILFLKHELRNVLFGKDGYKTRECRWASIKNYVDKQEFNASKITQFSTFHDSNYPFLVEHVAY